MAVMLGQTVLTGSFHVSESAGCCGLLCLRVAVLCWRACPFSTAFSRASLTAPLAEYAWICGELQSGVSGGGGEVAECVAPA